MGKVDGYSDVGLDEMFNHVLFEDLRYADSWNDQSGIMSDVFGVYRSVAKVLGNLNGKSHIDIGSGNGRLLSILRAKNPSANLWGMDVNPILIELAVKRMECLRKSRDVVFHGSFDGVVYPDGRIAREFPYHPEILGGRDAFGEGVDVLALDDVNAPKVVPGLAAGRKFDSASFLFPGAAPSTSRLYPYEFRLNTDEEHRNRLVNYAGNLKANAYRFATRIVNPDGNLVLGERLGISGQGDFIENIIAGFQQCFDSLGILDCWEFKEVSVSERSFSGVENKVPLIVKDGDSEVADLDEEGSSNIKVVLILLERTKAACEKVMA